MILERLSVVSRPLTKADWHVEADSMKFICQKRGKSEIYPKILAPSEWKSRFLANSKLQVI